MELWQKNATFSLSALSFQKDYVSLQKDSALCRFLDILNNEARASFSTNGNLRTSKLKTENAVQLFLRLMAWTSVIFRFQGFSGPPLVEYRREVCAFSVY